MNKGISLHIGIGMLGAEYRGGFTPITGAVNDARAMQDIARRNGFVTRLLCGRKATRQRFIDEITAATEELEEGDTMLITASCHGSFRENRTSEPSGFDANWCLHDAPIWDDEIERLLNCFREGVSIVVISDSCNTGTVIDVAEAGSGFIRHGLVEKSVLPEVAWRAYEEYMRRQGHSFRDWPQRERPARVLLISASQDHGLNGSRAYDAGSARGRYSRFTRALLNVWADGTFAGDYPMLFREIRNILSAPEHQPGPMFPNYVVDPKGSEEHWATMIPFTIGKRVPSTLPRPALMPLDNAVSTSVLTVKAAVTIDGRSQDANGAAVFVVDSAGKLRSVQFMYDEAIALFDLEPGMYTVYGMIPYQVEPIPNEDYSVVTALGGYYTRNFEMPAGDMTLPLDFGSYDETVEPGEPQRVTVRAVVTIDGLPVNADGTAVFVMDGTGKMRSLRFLGAEGSVDFDLAPGVYTIYGMIPYHIEEVIPGQKYFFATPLGRCCARILDVPAGEGVLLDLGGPGDKGDIRAVVKVDGQGRKGDVVNVDPGGFQKFTDQSGCARFTELKGGTYTVTANVVKICDGSPKAPVIPPKTALVPDEGWVEVRFDIRICPE